MGRRNISQLIGQPRGAAFFTAVATIVLIAPTSIAVAQHALVIDVHCPQAASARDEPFRPIYYPHLASAANASDFDETTPESLLKQFMQLHTASRYEDALEVADELVAIVPDHPLPHYNRACALARLQRTQDALDALERAIDHGWRDLTHLKLDPDLQSIRWHERYESFIALLNDAHNGEPGIVLHAVYECDTDHWRYESLPMSIPQWLDELHVPGTSVAMVQDGSLVWTAAFGKRDLATDESIEPNDLFPLTLPKPLAELARRMQKQNELDAPFVTGHTWMGTPICSESTCSENRPAVPITAEQFGQALAIHFMDQHESEQPLEPIATDENEKPHRFVPRPVSLELPADHRTLQQLKGSSNGIGWHVSWNHEHNSGVVVLYNAERGDALAERIVRHAMPHLLEH